MLARMMQYLSQATGDTEMIVTPKDARKIVAQHYGQEFADSVRFTPKGTSVYCRPSYETGIKLTLCALKCMPGKDSVVRLGLLLPGGGIDWSWDNAVV